MSRTNRARRSRHRRRLLEDPFFRSSHQQLEHLEQRRLLSASPLATDSPGEPPVDPAWFAAVAEPAETTRMATRFLDHAGGSQQASAQVDLSRWIVKLSDELVAEYPTPAAANELFAPSEMEVLSGLGLPGQLLVGAHCTTTGQALEFFANEPGILYYEADTIQTGTLIPNDPRFGQQFALHNTGQAGGIANADINAPAAWDVSTGSSDVVVAIIDSGIDLDHPDLDGNLWINTVELDGEAGVDDDNNGFVDDVHGWDFRNGDADPDDAHQHGTHVAGIIAAEGNNGQGVAGVTWHTSIMPLKFLGENNQGVTSDAVKAINYATMMRTRAENPVNIRVINNSYLTDRSAALEDAVASSAAADILFVVASGNGNPVLGTGFDLDSQPVYPASIDSTHSIVVGASGPFDELARFSNYGAETVDLVAPGVGIVSTVPTASGNYKALSGTSMAAPMVSGTAALLASHLPDITATEIKAAILGSVHPLDALQGKVATGGRLDAAAALTIDTYRPRVTLVSSNLISNLGNASYPVTIHVRDNVAIDLATLDNNDLRLVGPTGQQLNTVIAHDSTSGDTSHEKTVTYQVEAPAEGWSSSFNDTYTLMVVPDQVGDSAGNTSLAQELGQFTVDISLAGPMSVNSTEDLPDIDLADNISHAGDGKATLRSAIMQANHTSGLDTVTLPAGTYTLTRSGAGEDLAVTGDLDVTDSLTLEGDGTSTTIIDANGLDRVFDLRSGENVVTLTLKNMTIQGGNVTGDGGGILAKGNLVLENVVVTANTASGDGAGIRASHQLQVTGSSISSNTAGGNGAGIRFSGSATGNFINDSLLANNTATGDGGGLYSTASAVGALSATNLTVSGNQAAAGGGIQVSSAFPTVNLINVTVTDNRANGAGGGLRATPKFIVATNSIIAGNHSTTGHANNDVDGHLASTHGHNIIGIAGNATLTGITHGNNGNLVGTSATPIDPGLEPELGDYGGPTLVHSLVIGSPAIDAAYPGTAPDHDQRGLPRPMDGDGNDPLIQDIGAMEFKLLGEITGRQFHDRNRDGTQDPGEEGLAGWTVFLDINDNATLDAGEANTTTAADGSYAFVDLQQDDYVVAGIPQENWQQTEPAPPGPQYIVDPAFQVGDLIATEGDSGTTTFAFSATLAWPATTVSSVDYTVTHGTTTAADLAGPLSGTLTIPAGASSGTIEVLVQGDTETEPVEDFRLEFSNPVGLILGTQEATGYIVDNDTTFTVDTETDTVDASPGDGSALDAGGKTSLRAAIMEANALAGFQSIHVPAGNYTLSLPGADEDAGATGDLDITASDLAIIGAGTEVTTINGAGLDRVLDIKDATGVSLVGLTVADGSGGIRSRNSHATLQQTIIRNNAGTGLAVVAGSDVKMLRSRFTGNTGTGISVDDTSAATLVNSRIDNNGAAGISSRGTLLVRDSVIHGNRSSSKGGGIYATHEATIENSLILGNTASYPGGGGLYLDGDADDPGNFVLRGSSIYENTSTGLGGGLYISGSTLIDNTTIARNAAMSDGGGIYAADVSSHLYDMQLYASTITENRVGLAATGGVWADSTNVDLIAARRVQNTIIAANMNMGQRFNQPENETIHGWSDARGNLNSQGYNLVSAVEVIVGGVSPWVAAEGDLVGTPADPIEAGFLSRFSGTTSQCQLHDVYEVVTEWWDDAPNSCDSAHYQPPFLVTQYALGTDSPAVDAGVPANVAALDATGGARTATTGAPGLHTTAPISNSAMGAYDVYAVDVDGDGDMDLLSASFNDDKIAWYENDGNQAFTTHVITNIADGSYDVYAVDVDGDGDMDVLSASFNDDKIAWYENDGNQAFTTHVITTAVDGAQSVYAADVDGDGDMDVLSASFNDDKIAWYENDGNQTFTTHVITGSADGAYDVHAADIDGDGDMDILSASYNSNEVNWHRNDGNQVFTTRIIKTNMSGASSVYAADVDGDGHMDVVSASFRSNKIAWHENVIDEQEEVWYPDFRTHVITTTADGASSVYAADVDGDGDMDVLSASRYNSKIAWYENDGASNSGFWTDSMSPSKRLGHVITTAANGASGVYAADVDGDGDIDVLSSSQNDNKISWYENAPAVDMGAVERKHIDPPVLSHSVTLQPGDSVNNIHFGNAALPGRISGVQYFDYNGDGIRNTAWASVEGGRQGWQIFLDTNANDSYDVGEPTTTTNVVGYYEFDNLDPMQTHTVGAILPEGWQQTSPEVKPFPVQTHKRTLGNLRTGDEFGNSTSISGDTAIVGSAFDDDDGEKSGSAYIFKYNNTWSQVAKLTASDAKADDRFGHSVSISGDTAIVGSLLAGNWAGAAYIYQNEDGNWNEVAKLTASNSSGSAQFGYAVSISGDMAIVGARYDDGDESTNYEGHVGSAYIFQNVDGNWSQVARLTASDAGREHQFGNSVAISANTAIVGAHKTHANNSLTGSVYVFRNVDGTWLEETKLTASDGHRSSGDSFGGSLSMSGNRLIVGAYGASAESEGTQVRFAGAAYVFEYVNGTWSEIAKLTASTPNAGRGFANAVSISGNLAIVASNRENVGNTTNSGSAYVFQQEAGLWHQVSNLTANDAHSYDYFGTSVAISGRTTIVGMPGDDETGLDEYSTDHGSVYMFMTDPGLHTVSVTAGSQTTHDFGSTHQPATVEGQVYRDLDKDGINDLNESGRDEGWKITLHYIDTTGYPVNREVITDSDGFYRFDNLTPYLDYTISREDKIGTHETTSPNPVHADSWSSTLVQAYVTNPLADQLTDLAAIEGSDDFYFTGMDDHGRGFNSQELFYYDRQTERLTIVTPVNDPHGLVTDQDTVYWIDYDPDGQPGILRRLPGELENEVVYPTTDSDTQLTRPIDMVLISSDEQNTRLAVLDADAGQVWNVLITPTSNIVTPLGPARYTSGTERHHPSYLAYDQGTLYVLDTGLDGFVDMPGRLYSLPIEGNAWTVFYQGSFVEDARGITVNDNWLYYNHDQWIYTQPTNGLLWAQPVVSDPRIGSLGNLAFTNGTIHVLDKTANEEAASWQITIHSSVSVTHTNPRWNVRPEPGTAITGLDFGELKYGEGGGASNDYVVTGRVYRDSNGNAQLDEGETGLANVTVYLDLNNNRRQDDHEPVTTTLADIPETTGAGENEAGLYSFLDLAEGVYSVTVIPPDTLQQIGPLETTFTTSTVPVSDGPRTSASHDFNGDGHADLVVGSGTSNSVAVLLNHGDGTFADPVSYTTGHGPSDIAVGDINLDGTADLAVTNINASSVSVLTGNPDGTFNTATQYQVGWSPTGVVIGDVNADDRPDLVVSNDGADSISVLLAKAEGGFHAKADYPAGNGPQGLVLADFDRDGDLDLAIPAFETNDVKILHNDGQGVFDTIVSEHPVGAGPFSISVGNVDGDQDGLLDLVIANVGSSDLSLLVGTSNGTFEPAVPIPVGNFGSTGTALVDADHDGDLDIAVTSFSATNVAILLNEGGATFQTPVSYGVGAFFYALPFDVIAEDLDSDGNVDFIVANSTENQLTILGNQLAAGPRIVTASGASTTISDQDIRLHSHLAPTIAPLDDIEVNENSAAAAITLRGMTAGLGETQPMKVEVSIADPTLVSLLSVDYTNPASLGTLTIQPTAEKFGSSVVTIKVTDGGPDGDLANTADNMYTTETFTYTVHEIVNALPTLGGINTTTIDEDAPLQTINLASISPGGDEQQPLSISATSSNTELVPHPSVSYTSGETTGSIAFQGVADGFGSTEITVTVTDGGPDQNLETAADNASFQQSFTLNITSVNDKPVAADTSFEPTQDITISVDAAQGLLAIGSDVEDDTLSFTIVAGTDHGVLTTSADGSFSYLPNLGFNRTDSFIYQLNDGQAEHNLSDLATIDFHIDTPTAWFNSLKPLDVNDDTITTPLDVLWIINSLNSAGARPLVNARPKPLVAPFYDVNKDGFAAPLDALIIINALNMGAGEGEGARPGSYYDAPLSTAPVRSAASTTQSATQSTTPAATQLLPQDDAFRSQLAAEELAELVPADVDQDEETWRDALDQLLAEDLELDPLAGFDF